MIRAFSFIIQILFNHIIMNQATFEWILSKTKRAIQLNRMNSSYPHSPEKTRTPFAEIDVNLVVPQKRISHDKRASNKMIGFERVNQSQAFRQNGIRKLRVHIRPHSIHTHVASIDNDQSWQSRHMQEQTLARHPIVAITTPYPKVSEIHSHVRHSSRFVRGSFHTSAHIGETCQERPSAMALHIRLRECCWHREALPIESIISIHVEHGKGHATLVKMNEVVYYMRVA